MKHRILIVEDNILLAGQQKKWFEKSGYEAVTTIDEPGARRLLKKEPFDLVLSDVRLPQEHPASTLSHIRKGQGYPSQEQQADERSGKSGAYGRAI